MNWTLLEECFRAKGRTTWYETPQQLQEDLDRFLDFYNPERTHQGYPLKGRIPAQALKEALGFKELPTLTGISGSIDRTALYRRFLHGVRVSGKN